MKNYYVIVHEKRGTLLLNSAWLPIFWLKKVAEYVAKNHPGYVVKSINSNQLKKIIENGK